MKVVHLDSVSDDLDQVDPRTRNRLETILSGPGGRTDWRRAYRYSREALTRLEQQLAIARAERDIAVRRALELAEALDELIEAYSE